MYKRDEILILQDVGLELAVLVEAIDGSMHASRKRAKAYKLDINKLIELDINNLVEYHEDSKIIQFK